MLGYIIWASITSVLLFAGSVVGFVGIALDSSSSDIKNNSPALALFLLTTLISIISLFSICSMCIVWKKSKFHVNLEIPREPELSEML